MGFKTGAAFLRKMTEYFINISCFRWVRYDIDSEDEGVVCLSSFRYFNTMEEVEYFLATEYRDKTKYVISDSVDVMLHNEDQPFDNDILVKTIAIN